MYRRGVSAGRLEKKKWVVRAERDPINALKLPPDTTLDVDTETMGEVYYRKIFP